MKKPFYDQTKILLEKVSSLQNELVRSNQVSKDSLLAFSRIEALLKEHKALIEQDITLSKHQLEIQERIEALFNSNESGKTGLGLSELLDSLIKLKELLDQSNSKDGQKSESEIRKMLASVPPLGLFEGLDLINLALGGVTIATFSFYSSESIEKVKSYLPFLNPSTFLILYISLYFIVPFFILVISLFMLNTKNGFMNKLVEYKYHSILYLIFYILFLSAGFYFNEQLIFIFQALNSLIIIILTFMVAIMFYEYYKKTNRSKVFEDFNERIWLARRQAFYLILFVVVISIVFLFTSTINFGRINDIYLSQISISKNKFGKFNKFMVMEKYNKFDEIKCNMEKRGLMFPYSEYNYSFAKSEIIDSLYNIKVLKISNGNDEVAKHELKKSVELDEKISYLFSDFFFNSDKNLIYTSYNKLYAKADYTMQFLLFNFIHPLSLSGILFLVVFIIYMIVFWYLSYKERLLNVKNYDEYQEVNIFRANILIGIMFFIPIIININVPGFKISEPLLGRKEEPRSPEPRKDQIIYYKEKNYLPEEIYIDRIVKEPVEVPFLDSSLFDSLYKKIELSIIENRKFLEGKPEISE
jgi:hypothetical protein